MNTSRASYKGLMPAEPVRLLLQSLLGYPKQGSLYISIYCKVTSHGFNHCNTTVSAFAISKSFGELRRKRCCQSSFPSTNALVVSLSCAYYWLSLLALHFTFRGLSSQLHVEPSCVKLRRTRRGIRTHKRCIK